MSQEQVFTEIKAYFESKPMVAQALSLLDPGEEIRLVIGRHLELALFFDGDVRVENRPARSPNVEFAATPEGVRSILSESAENMADFGIAVGRQILAGEIHLRVCGSLLAVLRNGYLKIIAAAGPDFAKFIANHGLTGARAIMSFIQSLRR